MNLVAPILLQDAADSLRDRSAEPEKLRSNFIRGIKRLPVGFTPA